MRPDAPAGVVRILATRVMTLGRSSQLDRSKCGIAATPLPAAPPRPSLSGGSPWHRNALRV